jgi:uncharacterized protein (DUF1697 family)
MSELRKMLSDVGMEDPRTVLQSGNALFQAPTANSRELEEMLERETLKRLGVRTDYIIRTAASWAQVIAHNPLPLQAQTSPAKLLVMFFKDTPESDGLRALEGSVAGPETMRAEAGHLYIFYPEGMGRSRLSGAVIEKRLGSRGTARNWNTVMRIAEAARS